MIPMNEEIRDVDYTALGMRLKKVRTLRQYTQEALAEKSGVIGSYIGVIERAEKKPSISTLVRVANALNCSIDYLLYDSLIQSADRVYSINNDAEVRLPAHKSPNDIASLSNSLLPLLNAAGSKAREQEIQMVLEILRNITADYHNR